MNQLSLLHEELSEPKYHTNIAQVAALTYVDGYYSYFVPEDMLPPPLGAIVKVQFGKREVYGVIYGYEDSQPAHKLKPIKLHYENIPAIAKPLRDFVKQAAHYNCIPLGQALKLALPIAPPNLMQEKIRKTKDKPLQQAIIKPLSESQSQIADELCEVQNFHVALLDGATGSGKTEVFFAFAEKLMNEGKQVLLMLPEIALSLQLVERAYKRFGFQPVLWHSSQTPARRRDGLLAIMSGEAKLIIGARSALFLPYDNLGGIITDEEHESSYKQDDNASYHARDMAVLRAKIENIPIILSSATPSLESLANVAAHKYQHFTLNRRNNQAELPSVNLLDMKREKLPPARWISPTLQARLQANFEAKSQSLLFLNRKGYAPLVLCRGCGHRYECANCSAWLVYYAGQKNLQCHHCGLQNPLPPACPSCGADHESLTMCGPGVERIKEEVKTLFPTARLAIISGEQSKSPTSLAQTLSEIAAGEIDIIIGTQIIAKGHHFPHLSLVGAIDADAGLDGGDIRASERTYQMLHQIAGRAGREQEKGEVWLQTYQPNNPLMQALKNWDRAAFISTELQNRKLTNMPPYGRLAALIIESLSENAAINAAKHLGLIAPNIKGVRIIGASNAPLYKLRNQYRLRFLIIAEKNIAIQKILLEWRANANLPNIVKCKVDIDPVNFF
jgi:primosomal protein N' (replication factor Y) (superfamily II helicase)